MYEVLSCEKLTALIGPNGSGESAFLKAIDLFYNTSPKLNPEDFYNGDVTKNIQITLTYCELDDSERTQFGKYLQNDELSIVRVLSLVDGKASDKYHGSTLQNPDFVAVRKAGPATAMKELYVQLQQKDEYKALRKWKNQSDGLGALLEWEAANPATRSRELDDGSSSALSRWRKVILEGLLGISIYRRFEKLQATQLRVGVHQLRS